MKKALSSYFISRFSKRPLITLAMLLAAQAGSGQITYSGSIDKYPIELLTYIYSDGDARAIYAYKSHNEPIIINGRLKGRMLALYEMYGEKDTTAIFVFNDYDSKKSTIAGLWRNLKTNKELNVTLKKEFDLDAAGSFDNKEIIQPVALKDFYFRVLVSKEKDRDRAGVTGLKIINKKTNEVYQQIVLDCQLMGIESISVNDYNFDGSLDFSVFESSYAGPNTSSIYFLYDPKTKKFFNSKFEGVSLDFDQKTKTIWESNSCCAGRIRTSAQYKVVNNKMVLLERHCYILDEKTEDYVEKDWKECE